MLVSAGSNSGCNLKCVALTTISHPVSGQIFSWQELACAYVEVTGAQYDVHDRTAEAIPGEKLRPPAPPIFECVCARV